MCFLPDEILIKQLRKTLKTVEVQFVFVASDYDHKMELFQQHFGRTKVKFIRSDNDNPHRDLAVLGKAKLFIGNCASSFSAFVKRERDVNDLETKFWAFPSQEWKRGHDPGEL